MKTRGFTIVELAVVITVIAILAAITIVSYRGMQDRALDAAVQTDLRNMHDAAALTTTSGMGASPTANQAGLQNIVTISRTDAYFQSIGGGSLAYCRNNEHFAFVARSASGSTPTNRFSSKDGYKSTTYSSNINTLCSNAGIPSSGTGYASIWLYNATLSPKWQSWISL